MYVQVPCVDFDRSVAFYVDELELFEVGDDHTYTGDDALARMKRDGNVYLRLRDEPRCGIVLVHAPNVDATADTHERLWLETPGIEALYRRVSAAPLASGATIRLALLDTPMGDIFSMLDPAGNRVDFISALDPAYGGLTWGEPGSLEGEEETSVGTYVQVPCADFERSFAFYVDELELFEVGGRREHKSDDALERMKRHGHVYLRLRAQPRCGITLVVVPDVGPTADAEARIELRVPHVEALYRPVSAAPLASGATIRFPLRSTPVGHTFSLLDPWGNPVDFTNAIDPASGGTRGREAPG